MQVPVNPGLKLACSLEPPKLFYKIANYAPEMQRKIPVVSCIPLYVLEHHSLCLLSALFSLNADKKTQPMPAVCFKSP
jgi:hypothetical protein